MKQHCTTRPCFFLSLVLLVSLATTTQAQTKRPMELEDMFRIKRVSEPVVSPDGRRVLYVVTVVDKAANKLNSDIWIIPSDGGEARQLTNSPKNDRHPRWSPDGTWISFESNRNGSYQIYIMPAGGGEARQLTTISTEASGAVWSPDGTMIAFLSSVFPEFSDKPYKESDALNRQKQALMDTGKVKAKIFTQLYYRHWDSWVDGKRQHVFVVPANGGDPRDVTPGDRDGAPTSSTFSAGDEYDFSPDGKELAYTATPVPAREESWNTNHDIYTVNLATGEQTQITTNRAADGFPRYSPDGKYLAYRAQRRPGFEADRWELMLLDRTSGVLRSLTEASDISIGGLSWLQDSKSLYFDAEEKGGAPLWLVTTKGGDVRKVVDTGMNTDISLSNKGNVLAFSRHTITRPSEVYISALDGKNVKQLSRVNDNLFSSIELSQVEQVWYEGAAGAKVHMWIVKPPKFDPSKTYPLVFWVHGGPQGSWGGWSFRWCAQLWAAQGYVLALPNPRGSTGFGQKFLDEISRDWGGKVYTDLMNGVAYLETLPYIDATRMAAAGASYGGYMMNWFQGHTTKFTTLITHCGVFNYYSMYGVTDEKWFDEWEHGIPWETPDFDKQSPHLYADKFSTPNLIIHNEGDYRVPISEGMSLFTTLQRKGVPSKLLYFPDETHFVSKPLNSELWHRTVFDWLADYLKK